MGFDDGLSFENRIYAKAEAAAILRRDLSRPKRGEIAIGTATDPYQPAERNYGVTRALLEVFAEGEGRQLSITTKSDLVTRDVDLLLKSASGTRSASTSRLRPRMSSWHGSWSHERLGLTCG